MVDNNIGVLCFISGLAILVIICWVQQKKKQLKIKRWKKTLNLTQHEQVFQQLYRKIDGFTVSRLSREKKDAIEYTYGEIEFITFIALLSLVNPDQNTVFYDLGCGTGKAVIACAMVYPVHKSIGIELLPELYSVAQQQVHQLATYSSYQKQNIHIIHDDILTADLSDATLIFINATTFLGAMWQELSVRLSNLPQLQTVITTSKALPNKDFALQGATQLQTSWGVVPAFIHTRKQFLH